MKRGHFGIILTLACCALALLTSCNNRDHNSMYPEEPDEYPLDGDIPDHVRAKLDPWIAGFIGLTTAEANERLAERWSSIERPSLKALRDTLSKFEVRAIVDYEEGGLIYAYRPGSKDEGIGDFFYLPAPLNPEEIQKRLEPSKLQGNDALREFLFYFGGLAEDTATAGQFVYSDPPWPLFTDSWDGEIKGFEEWENALMLYHARNGCFILVRPDGKVAWWVMQEGIVETEAEDFDDFILKFNEHRKISWPYDPYGASD